MKNRFEIIIWGALACAQPWLVAKSMFALFWLTLAITVAALDYYFNRGRHE